MSIKMIKMQLRKEIYNLLCCCWQGWQGDNLTLFYTSILDDTMGKYQTPANFRGDLIFNLIFDMELAEENLGYFECMLVER